MSLHYSYSIQHQCKMHFKYEKILYLTMRKIEQEILGREKKKRTLEMCMFNRLVPTECDTAVLGEEK